MATKPRRGEWRRHFSAVKVAHAAGYRTSEAICEYCGDTTTCHASYCGFVRCIACEEE